MLRRAVHRLKTTIVAASLAAVVVMVGGVAAVSTAIGATQLVAQVNVNVRSGPGTDNAIIGTLPKGATVSATGPAVEGKGSGTTWTPISYNGKPAYVATNCFKVTETSDESPKTTTGSSGTGTATSSVNVRSGPSTSYAVVGLLTKGTKVTLTGTVSGLWLQIEFSGSKRWVHSSYVTKSTSSPSSSSNVGQVRVTATAYLRAEGAKSAAVLGTIPGNTIVDVTGKTTSTYTQIVYKGTTGWVASSLIKAATASPLTSDGSGASDLSTAQKKIVNFALAQVGKAYVWGAAGPNAFDCSGFTLSAYKAAGLSLPHYSRSQAALGKAVAKSDLQPGDLIFWYSPISHVSLYIGNGQMVHARNTRVGVVQQSVQSYISGGGDYRFARRILS